MKNEGFSTTPLSCIIVDDEPLAVRLLESFVTKTPDLTLAGSFTDSVEAINAVKEQKPDLLFLDIQMPDLNGMELARIVPPETRIIFTTAFKEYAFESYEVRALDFLLKPIRYNKFLAAVDKAREWFLPVPTRRVASLPPVPPPVAAAPAADTAVSPPRTLFLRVDGDYRQVAVADILYVSSLKDYVMFHLDGESRPLVTHLTMKAVSELLPPALFMRVHRSFIVRLDKITKVDRNDCIYIGTEIIHVTDAFLPAFQQYLRDKAPQQWKGKREREKGKQGALSALFTPEQKRKEELNCLMNNLLCTFVYYSSRQTNAAFLTFRQLT